MVLMSFTRVLTATGLLLASSFFAAPAGALPMPHPQLGIDLGLDGVAHDEVRVALPANTGYGWFNFTVLPHGSTSAPFTASVNYTFPRGALGFVDIKFV